MEEKDLPDVSAIEKASYSNPWHETTFIGEIHNRPISFPYVVVDEDEKKIIGYVIYWHGKEQVQISNIAVHPDYRRKGVGEAVLREIMARVKGQGVKFIILEVRPSNLAALNLYKKLGFEILGLRKDYYRNPREDALVMGKGLSQ